MRYRFLLTTSAAFLVMAVTAGAWIGVAERITRDQPGLPVVVMGGIFSAAFVWLLITRLRALLANPERRGLELALLAVNFAILIVTFAWIHHRIGIMDLSGPAPRPTRDFGAALYFSIVTATTLGFGDFIPIGHGRSIAAMQALVGYFILGILVSTGFQILAPDSGAAAREREEADDDGAAGSPSPGGSP